MRNFALYRITDGTADGTVSLLQGVDGFWLVAVQEEINDWKGGGVWEDSPLSEGRQMISAEYATAIDRYSLGSSGPCQLPAEDNIRKLEQLLQKADQYWTTRWQKDVVWIERLVNAPDAEMQFAVVRRGRLPGLGEMVDWRDARVLQPVAGQASQELLVERLFWQDYRPGGCIEDGEEVQEICTPVHLEFVAGDGDNVNCGSDASLDDLPDGAAFTVEAQVRADTGGQGDTGYVICKGTSWFLGINTIDVLYSGLHGYIDCVTDANSSSGLDDFAADGQWHHVLMTYDETGAGTPAARTIYLAIDGEWVASYVTQTASVGAYVSDAAEDLIVGNRAALDRGFDGGIGWVRVSDIVRYDPAGGDFTPEPRCDPPATDANTVLLVITEDVAPGNTTTDLSASGNDGTITGADWACDCDIDSAVKEVPCNCVEASARQAWDYAGWDVHDAQPDDNVRAIVETTSGTLVACQDVNATTNVWYTTNGNAPWTAATVWPAPNVDAYAMVEASDGYLYLVGNDTVTGQVECWRSTDDGDNWTLRNNNVAAGAATVIHSSITERGTSGELYIACSTGIYQSVDWGTTWAAVYTAATAYSIVYHTPSALLYATAGTAITSTDGVAWSGFASLPRVLVTSVPYECYISNDKVFVSWDSGAGATRELWTAPGWTLADDVNSSLVGVTYDSGFYRIIYANGEVYRSQDATLNSWSYSGDIGTGTGGLHYYADNGYTYAGEAGDIYYLGRFTVTAGRSATCTDEVMVANKQNVAQVTNVKVFDASVPSYTDMYPMGNAPHYILPDPFAIGDILYVGIDSGVLDSGPYCSLVFDLYQALISTAPTFDIEYSDGGAGWPALNVHDETNNFQADGVSVVNFVPPSDWAAEAVDGVTAYWVRFEVTGVGVHTQTPIQWQRDIYTVVWPRVDIDEGQLTGDVTTLLRIKAHNRSDEDGYDTIDELDLLANRYIIGARWLDRGELFTAYLNCSDEQNPTGVTTTDGIYTTTGDNILAPTGRAAVHGTTGNGLTNYDDAYTFTLAPSIARDFYGVFHAYLRAGLQDVVISPIGDHDDVRVRLRFQTGSGGVQLVTDFEKFVGWDAFGDTYKSWQLLDFGKIALPVSEEFTSDELSDEFTITVQIASAAATNLQVNLFDLVLMPVDEWAGDFVDGALEDDSGVTVGYLMDVDSVSYPKEKKRALVRTADDAAYIRSRYQTITPSPSVVQSKKDMRLWFLTARGAYLGEHTGGGAAAVLTDSYADFIDAGVGVGDTIFNITDGSNGPITAFTETTVTATLAGGAGNDWDNTDEYLIVCDHWRSEPYVVHSVQLEGANRFLSVRGS